MRYPEPQSATADIHAQARVSKLLKARADASPLLGTDNLLAYGEDHYHQTHYVPREALLGLVDMMHGQGQAIFAARKHGAAQDAFMYVEPSQLGCLLQLIADKMHVDLPVVGDMQVLRAEMNVSNLGEKA